ncbi:DegV family protein [Sutcliffiella rhizosphaerae]|uniref:DegV domain-containing protein n=1 Tax=Sutcliffiella rhizosphaerae TaxID=2880967 RepID=A0ABM8YQC5_9BACI|nr:DegV family protein [Sutcliffiella rhizosphaerae]CAG9622015.1 DegV domain-containing protein [Sutcliffiella rhizosphaerae]
MERIAWVTDSTAYLDDMLKEHQDVYSIPMVVYFEGEEFLDGVTLSLEDFYTKMENSSTPPKTSQPSVGAFVELYNQLAEKYDRIISVHLSSHLSGTVSSSKQASELVDIPVHTIDSKVISFPLSAMVKKGIRSQEEGKHSAEIIEYLENLSNNCELYVLIGSLEQLHRSGRMSGVQKLLGSLLQIKPIIKIEDGKLEVVEKVRTQKKALSKILDFVEVSNSKSPLKELFVLHGTNHDEAKALVETLKGIYSNIPINPYPLSTAIAVHAGVNTIGIAWYNE